MYIICLKKSFTLCTNSFFYINVDYFLRPINATEMQLLLKTEDGKVLRFVAAPVANDIDYVAIQPESKTKPTSSNGNDKKPNIKIVSNQKLSMAKMVRFEKKY